MKRCTLQIWTFSITLLIGLAACNPNRLSPTEHWNYQREGAIMPVHVEGNFDSEVFILLLHGGPGGNGQEYNLGPYSEMLEEDYAMVYWDQRGQGSSQGSYGEELVTVQTLAEDTEGLIRVLKEKYGSDISIFLMGHSWGGMLGSATLVNTDAQQNLNGWIEVSGAHDVPRLNQAAIRMFIEIGQEQISQSKNVEQWQEIVDWAQTVDTNAITLDQSGQINEYGFTAEGLIDEIAPGTPSNVGFLYQAIGSPTNPLASSLSGNVTSDLLLNEVDFLSLTGQLNQITIPSLFIWGEYDFVVPPALMHEAFDAVNSTHKTKLLYSASGHSPMDNEAQKFARDVKDFIELHK